MVRGGAGSRRARGGARAATAGGGRHLPHLMARRLPSAEVIVVHGREIVVDEAHGVDHLERARLRARATISCACQSPGDQRRLQPGARPAAPRAARLPGGVEAASASTSAGQKNGGTHRGERRLRVAADELARGEAEHGADALAARQQGVAHRLQGGPCCGVKASRAAARSARFRGERSSHVFPRAWEVADPPARTSLIFSGY